MNKALSIAFLVLIVFYMVGYKLLFFTLHYNVDKKMLLALETENYSDDETITIKIPIDLPYPIHNQGFQKAQGEIEHEGEFYNLVKQKVEKDTLYVVCIRNVDKKSVQSIKNEFEKIAHNLPNRDSNKQQNLLKTLDKVYLAAQSLEENLIAGYNLEKGYSQNPFSLHSRKCPVFSPPPESFI